MTELKGKILYHHRTQGHGAEGSHIRGMVDGFRDLGFRVDIAGPPGVDPYGAVAAEIGSKSFFKKILARFADSAPQVLFELVELLYTICSFAKLYFYSRQQAFNFVYERYALNSLAGAWLKKATGIPLVLEVNDATVIERSRPLVLKAIAKWNEKFIFSKADFIITISNHFKHLIVTQHQIKPEKVLVLPNAIDPKKFDLTDKDRFRREDLGIPENAVVLGCVGAFVPWHGLEFLLDALEDVAKEKKLFFLFVGDGPVRNTVISKASACGIENHVLFTGFVSADLVPKYLDVVDICVIPGSNAHCSPMKLFEYMAMGKPIVLPEYQPLLETVSPGKEGLFFRPHDAEGLAAQVLQLVDSEDLRKETGAHALATVQEKYTWAQNCSKVLDQIDPRSGRKIAFEFP